MKVNGHWVSCVRNSSYSFMPIHLKLYMCYWHGLSRYACGLDILQSMNYLLSFYSQFELSHFFGHFSEWIEGTLYCVRNSSYNLILILLKLCRHCDHAFKICMWLGYTPQINFCHFFFTI